MTLYLRLLFPIKSIGSERDPVWLVPSSVFTMGAENVLPVELAGFTARADGEQTAVLEWQTLTETSSDGFLIQRRRSNTDVGATGRSPEWKSVAFVNSKAEGGTSQEPLSYQFRVKGADRAPDAGRQRAVERRLLRARGRRGVRRDAARRDCELRTEN